MSGKRSQKKQQKRQAEALAQLEELYRRAKDDELLARAAELGPTIAASPVAARWEEAADRAVRESLAGADLGRLDRLLRSLRRNGPLRPLAILAKAVLDLAAGRLEEARASLAAVTAGAGVPGVPPRLLTDLEALARSGPDRPRKERAYPRAAAELFVSLRALETGGFAPTAAERKALARRLRALRDLTPGEPETPAELEAHRFLDGAGRCLALLAELETELWPGDPEDAEARRSQALVAWIRRTGPALGAALGAPAPPLLAPLRQAVAIRWRSVLAGVAARQGAAGLAALWSADPRLLACHLELPQVVERSRQRAQAERLLGERRYAELAELLRSRGRTASTPADLAALWSLELWARSHWDDEDSVGDEEDLPPSSEPYVHRTLVRVAEMAGEIGRRIPAEQRPGVARVLAGELFALCEVVGFCDHTAAAALSLLEHQPGNAVDAELLLAGLAGAVASDAPRSRRALLSELDRRGRGTAGLSPVARRLLASIASEPPRPLALILRTLQALFADAAWPEVTELVAQEMGGSFVEALDGVSLADLQGPKAGARAISAVRGNLDLLRPALGGTLGFAAFELILAGWPDAIEPRLAPFLAAFPGWEAPLTALRVLAKAMDSPWSPPSLNRSAGRLARAVVDRLDGRWPLWCKDLPTLALTADRNDLERLETRVRQLLAAPEAPGEHRDGLAAGLEAIQEIGRLRFGGGKRRRAQGRKKPRRRSAEGPQFGFEF